MSENFLDDYIDLESFAAQVRRHPRTVRRWMNEPNGLPYVQLGNSALVHIPTARAWLEARMQNPNPLKKKRSRSRR
jgi:hypothetical protein